MRIALIAAMAENRVIGMDNALPWHLPGDMQWFRRNTLGKPVIMGRRTYESIGRPLPRRENIVITRDPAFHAPGCRVVTGLPEACRAAGSAPEVMIMGGASVYAQALPGADRLYLTVVHGDVEGDAYFPEFDWNDWQEVERSEHPPDPQNPYPYTFVVLDRAR